MRKHKVQQENYDQIGNVVALLCHHIIRLKLKACNLICDLTTIILRPLFIKVVWNSVFPRSANLESKLVDFFAFINF